MSLRPRSGRVFTALAVLVMGPGALAQDCTAALGYVRDTTTNSSTASFRRYFCDQTSSSYQQEKGISEKLGIPIDNLPISFEGKYRDSDWQEYKRRVCEATQAHNTIQTIISRANEGIVQAWERCITAQGVKFWAEANESNPQLLQLSARYVQIGSASQAKIGSDLSINPVSGLTCDGQLGFSGAQGTRFLDGNISKVNCTRPNRAAVNVILKSDYGDQALRLPRVARPLTFVQEVTLVGGQSNPVCTPGQISGAAVCGPYRRVEVYCATCDIHFGSFGADHIACAGTPAVPVTTFAVFALNANESICRRDIAGKDPTARVEVYR